ncbi:Rv1157c family protein [Gordonia sp. (in: high G+C Gram-positive bacteria)]|uniref:Rv1157c family protein n=1 Tax=unclassified Gordonia (in: high G+C Gram-positive bacteria) TaxID=2657482 RepID=UPI002631EE36|nr:hypothetical protein [Gordonia sp. (in: high G+C Gram-positive bacteria)]
MRLARSRRTLLAAVSLTAAVAVATPVAHAEPAAPAAGQEQLLPIPDLAHAPEVNQQVLDSLGAFAPALIGSVATRDVNGQVNTKLLDEARSLADNPALPTEVADTWRSLIDFLGEPGKAEAAKIHAAEDAKVPAAKKKDDAPDIPTGPNKPRIQQFLYPTIGLGCMPGGGNSVGMALVTAGPQAAPAPGPKRGQAGVVYTSLGTGPALKNSAAPLMISWLNLDTGRSGQQRLLPNPKINAQKGPGTFTAIIKTGRGRIVSTISGTVTTKTKGKRIGCGIAPTIGIAVI